VELVYFGAVGSYGINLLNIWCGAGWRIFISRGDFLQKTTENWERFRVHIL